MDLNLQLGRDPTDVEAFDMGQSNSEHSRHWFFGGVIEVDGVARPSSLFSLVKATLKAPLCNANSVRAAACCSPPPLPLHLAHHVASASACEAESELGTPRPTPWSDQSDPPLSPRARPLARALPRALGVLRRIVRR